MTIEWEEIWTRLEAEFPCDPRSIHGTSHWRRVEENGLILAAHTGAVAEVVRLFAVFHDCRRENDGSDHMHGARAAEYALQLRGDLFHLPDEHFELLRLACAGHTDGTLSADPTIGTCWDADRLDLGRVGTRPHPFYTSTAPGKELAVRMALTL